MNLFELTSKISIDTSQVEKGLQNTQKNSETLTNKIKVMSAQLEAAQKNVDKLTQEFNESVSKTGSASKETQELAKKLDDAEKEAEQAKKALDGYNSEVEETEEKTEKASGGLSNFASKLGKGLATAAKIGSAAIGVAATGIAALTKTAVQNFAEYEQLVGGVDTLFKDASKKVQQYAADAYKTSGMSANDYMANATAFSASLISSLGGDTEAAAEYANRAMVSMSDNANKMGTSIDSIVQTYQSLSRGNFAMLDNLKLGYGGTKSELERLISDAASYTDVQKEMGITVDKSSTSFDNIVNAIAVVQGKLGVAGATAEESATTIEGSLNSMKAAWSNLLIGIADDNADFEGLIEKFVETIVGDGTKKNLGVFGNLLPRIKIALNGIVKLIGKLAPIVVQEIPKLADAIVPALIDAAMNLVKAVTDVLPSLLETASDVLLKNAPLLINALVDLIRKLVDSLGDEKNLETITKGAVDILMTLLDGFINLLPQVITVGTKILISLVEGLADALPEAIPMIVDAGIALIDRLINVFLKTDWAKIGGKIINGLWEGIKAGWEKLTSWFNSQWTKFKNWLQGEANENGNVVKAGGAKIGGRSFGTSLSLKVPTKEEFEKNQKSLFGGINAFAQASEAYVNERAKNAKKILDTIVEEEKLTEEELRKIEEERLERQKNLRQEFLDFVENTTSQMIDLEQEYQDKLAARSKTIENSYDIFEEVAEREKVNYIELLNNLAMQNANVERFYGNIEKLRARGVGEDLINELLGKGVSAIDELDAILGMSDEFLAEYEAMYEKRAEIADKYANIQLAGEKSALEKNLETMFDSIGATYDANAEELGVSFIENFIEKIKEGTASIAIALKTTISDALAQVMGTGSLLKTTSGGGIANSITSALVGALGGNAESGGLGIYLDGNLLVGGIAERTNGALGDSYALDERGAIA